MTGAALITQLFAVAVAVLLAPLFLGWVNMCRAWLQNRGAPPITQPYRMIRKLLEVDLFEISIVTFPMLPDAKVTGVKSITTERDFEQFLRDAGFSKSEAVAVTLHGFKGLAKRRDAGEDKADDEGLSSLLSKLNTLKDKFHG